MRMDDNANRPGVRWDPRETSEVDSRDLRDLVAPVAPRDCSPLSLDADCLLSYIVLQYHRRQEIGYITCRHWPLLHLLMAKGSLGSWVP